MRVSLILWLGFLGCFAQMGEDTNRRALEKAKALSANRPLSFKASMWTADLEGVTTSSVSADVSVVDLKHFRLTMVMEGSYKGHKQKTRGLLVADGTHGWRMDYFEGKPSRVVKTHVDRLLGAGLDSFPLLLTPTAWVEAIMLLDLEETERNGESVILKGVVNKAFQNRVPALRNEPSIAGLAIEIHLHPERGFPLTLAIQVEPELKALIRYVDVETLDQITFKESLRFVPPEGVPLRDKTQAP